MRLGRVATFLTGVGFAALPAVGPFIAIIAALSGRIRIQKADLWWWVSAVLLSVPYLVTGHFADAGLSTVQVLAIWLIYRSATEFRRSIRADTVSQDLGLGLVVGLAITLALGLRQMGELRFDLAITTLDAIVWNTHPALFGHTILVLSALLALVVPSPRLRVVALAIGAIGVVVSGSSEAVWAWLVIALGLRFVGRRGVRATRIAEWTLIGLMTAVVFGLTSLVGLGRIGFLTDFAPKDSTTNIFRGTEISVGDWWFPLGIDYTTGYLDVEGTPRTSFVVTKEWTESWARLQQAVTLSPGETYTLSVIVRSPAGSRPGFDGWGRESTEVEAANLATTLEGDTHRATTTGAISVLTTSAVSVSESLVRMFVTFRYTGEEPLTWYVGMVPDRSNRTGVTTVFSEFQLTASQILLPYRAGTADRGVTDLNTSRFPIWRDALDAIGARPIFGWGPNGLPEAIANLRPDETLLRPVAAHAHNALLAAWVDRGLIGALGLIGVFALLALRAVQQRDKASAVVLAGVLLANTFDSTLLSGPVIYPLAAVLGWRAVGHRQAASAETGLGSATAVRLGLATSDLVAGIASMTIGLFLAGTGEGGLSLGTGWTLPLLYTCLIWPAVAAAARQYPGYGRPTYQELALSVRSSAAAGVLVGFVALLVPEVFRLNAQVFLFAVPASVVLAPLFRSLTKLVLRRLRLWGRPVVVLGTEAEAARVARHLLGHPGIGLHPVAAFGSSSTWDVRALPITGTLDHAWDYVDQYAIRHAIVTRDAAVTAAFDQVLLRSGKQLKYVQYLPDLRGLPTNSVVASPLGSTLALEARNQLASEANRIVKRVIDFVGSALLLAVLGIPLGIIALIIRLDSRGSPLHLSPRIGRYGNTFNCIKFRTMYLDADGDLERLLKEQPELRVEYQTFHKLENDPRVTRVGKLLRRVSLDEFPQLLNVLVGQMSLVGPRPYLERERDIMGSERDLIFLARPGMTGYWQIEARNDVSFEERQSMEAHYVRNWSVWWDIDIMLRTPGVMLSKTGK
jgi:Undecaprenyl-phosphate galactose phosphotransferase WbaP